MRVASLIFAVLGILVVILAFIGRFHGPPTVTILGIKSAATNLLVLANTLLLIALFLGQWKPPEKKS